MTNRLEQQAPSAVPISSPARGSPCPESPCCPGTGRCISKRMQTFPVSKLQSVPHPQGGDCCAGRSSESTGMRKVSRDFIIFQKTRKKNYINQQNRKFLCIGNMLWSIINKKWWAFSDFKLCMHQTYKHQQRNTACNLLTYRTIRGKCVLWEEHTAEPCEVTPRGSSYKHHCSTVQLFASSPCASVQHMAIKASGVPAEQEQTS